jgi:hypothetical protein
MTLLPLGRFSPGLLGLSLPKVSCLFVLRPKAPHFIPIPACGLPWLQQSLAGLEDVGL